MNLPWQSCCTTRVCMRKSHLSASRHIASELKFLLRRASRWPWQVYSLQALAQMFWTRTSSSSYLRGLSSHSNLHHYGWPTWVHEWLGHFRSIQIHPKYAPTCLVWELQRSYCRHMALPFVPHSMHTQDVINQKKNCPLWLISRAKNHFKTLVSSINANISLFNVNMIPHYDAVSDGSVLCCFARQAKITTYGRAKVSVRCQRAALMKIKRHDNTKENQCSMTARWFKDIQFKKFFTSTLLISLPSRLI